MKVFLEECFVTHVGKKTHVWILEKLGTLVLTWNIAPGEEALEQLRDSMK